MPSFHVRPGGERLAFQQIEGSGPTVVYLHGFNLNMREPKAVAVADWARREGRSALLLDLTGCGESGGDFEQCTIDTWRDDILFLIDELTSGPLVLVGASLGGWLMIMVALARRDRVAGLVGIAAGPDFTDWVFDDAVKGIIREHGRLETPDPESDRPAVITLAFFESGQANLVLHEPIALDCPVRLIHGLADEAIDHAAAFRLQEALISPDVQLILVKGGDHSLARATDLDLITSTVARVGEAALAHPAPQSSPQAQPVA